MGNTRTDMTLTEATRKNEEEVHVEKLRLAYAAAKENYYRLSWRGLTVENHTAWRAMDSARLAYEAVLPASTGGE